MEIEDWHILEDAPFGYAYHRVVLGKDGQPTDYVFLAANATFRRLLGLAQSLQGRRVREVLPEAQKSQIDWKRLYPPLADIDFPRGQSGLYKVYSYAPVDNHLAVCVVDISDDTPREPDSKSASMQEKLRLQAAILDQNSEFILAVGLDKKVRFVNQTVCHGLGRRKDELLGLDLDELTLGWKNAFVPDHVIHYTLQFGQWQGDLHREAQLGQEKIMFCRTWVLHDEQMRPEAVIISMLDVTEARRSEQTMQTQAFFQKLIADISAEFLSANVSNIHDKIEHMLQVSGRFLGADRAYLFRLSEDRKRMVSTNEWSVLGIEPVEGSGEKELARFPWFSQKAFAENVFFIEDTEDLPMEASAERREFKRQGIKSLLSINLTGKDGRCFGFLGFDWLRQPYTSEHATLALLQVLGNTVSDALASYAMEMELRLAKEQAELGTQTKNQFLANISHEIRTPMNGISGFLQLLEQTEPTPIQSEYIDSIRHSTDTLLYLVNDILDLSRIESGKLSLNTETFDVRAELNNVLRSFAPRIEQKRLSLTLDVDSAVPQYVLGDAVRFSQVIRNLVSNAVKFTEHGGITVVVQVESHDRDRWLLRFLVKDSGIGMDEGVLAGLFEPFRQGNNERNSEFSGAGLGLSICKSIVDLMGGSIDVASKKGEGTQFTILFPFKETDTTDSVPSRKDSNHGAPLYNWPPQLRVLIVEDNPINSKILVRLLEKQRIAFDVANNGEEAIAAYKRSQHNIILMDCQMPVMDGYEATQKIRQMEPEGQHTTIIAMTAYAMKGDAEKCFATGMDDYLNKPIHLENVLETIAKWAKTRR